MISNSSAITEECHTLLKFSPAPHPPPPLHKETSFLFLLLLLIFLKRPQNNSTIPLRKQRRSIPPILPIPPLHPRLHPTRSPVPHSPRHRRPRSRPPGAALAGRPPIRP